MSTDVTIEYRKNGGEWISMTINVYGTQEIQVEEGDIIEFRGSNPTYHDGNCGFYLGGGYETTAKYNIEGNIMSMIYGDDFSDKISLSSGYTFSGLFQGCTGLTSAENLVLPATTLASDCYGYMFGGCTSLTTAPSILPATTLADYCYSNMFAGCTSLTTAPELPATTLKSGCYYGMFQGCTSLTTAPELPAITLADRCYDYMFFACTSLTTAPELPATTLADYCYYEMFRGCTSLNYIKCLATNKSARNCTSNWVNGVSSTGTFVKNPNMSSWTTGADGIPANWTVQDA